MNLNDLYKTLSADEKKRIAEAAGTKPVYIYQILTGRRDPSARLARALNRADPRFRLEDLRPDIWGDMVA